MRLKLLPWSKRSGSLKQVEPNNTARLFQGRQTMTAIQACQSHTPPTVDHHVERENIAASAALVYCSPISTTQETKTAIDQTLYK